MDPKRQDVILIAGLPPYRGDGRVSENIYLCGTLLRHLNSEAPPEARMRVIENESKRGFFLYREALQKAGFTSESQNRQEDNYFAVMAMGSRRVYVTFMERRRRLTVIEDHLSIASARELSYDTDEESSVKKDAAYSTGNERGLPLAVRCADGKIIVIDGEDRNSAEVTPVDGLDRFLHRVAGKSEDERVSVAAYILTGQDSEQAARFGMLLERYGDKYELERVLCNMPSAEICPSVKELARLIYEKYPDCRELKLHTGEKLRFADVTVEIMYTYEDAVEMRNGKLELQDECPHTVLRVTSGETGAIITGDTADRTEEIITEDDMKEIGFYAMTVDGRRIELNSAASEGGTLWTLPKESFADEEGVRIFCDEFNARAGDKGFYLMPESTGSYGAPLVRFTEREDSSFRTGVMTLSHYAVGLADATYLVMVDRVYKYKCVGECEKGHYRICLEFDFTVQQPADDICLRVFGFPSGTDYNGLARFIRSYKLDRGDVRTLRDKCAERAELDYARKYPMIRIRMGWKPAPPTVLHQTPENEPPMHVACTFSQVRELARALKQAGVEGAELCLVGWNQKGHDGRWPQIFPVEEALGGEEELRKTVEYVQSLGYRITCHTNSSDHYEIADIFDRNALAYRADGTFVTGGQWSGGACHHACPVHQLRLAKEQLPQVARLGYRGLHYIDVITITDPDACYHEEHPCTTREGLEYMREIMRMSAELFGGFASEGGMDFALGELDFALYNRFKACFAPSEEPFVDRFIPFYELIYHGIVLYNPSSTSVNYPIKSADEANTVRLLGSLPTFYLYSRFRSEGKNWMGEVDLTCDTPEAVNESVRAIKAAYDAYSPDRQFVFIHSLDIPADGLYAVTYEDGYCVIGNYTDKELEYNGITVPPHSFAERIINETK